jgi:hypothetical protein
MSVTSVAVMYQPPITNSVYEIARVFCKRMYGEAINNDQGRLEKGFRSQLDWNRSHGGNALILPERIPERTLEI